MDESSKNRSDRVSAMDKDYVSRVQRMMMEEQQSDESANESEEIDDSDEDPDYVLPAHEGGSDDPSSSSPEEEEYNEEDALVDGESIVVPVENRRLPPYIFGRLRKKEHGPPYVWSTTEPPQNVRTPASNIVRGGIPGLSAHSRALGNKPDPVEVWNLLFDQNMLQMVVQNTNQKLSTVKANLGHGTEKSNYRATDVAEVNAYMGLLLLSSILKSSHEDMRSLFSKGITNRPIFTATMSAKRFEILTACLRFDDANTRAARKAVDKAAPVSELFSTFISNSQKSYVLSEYITIDEMLIPFRGRCQFKMFMPKKPKKYGIKVMCLCDAKTSYLFNAYIYTGAGSDGVGLAEKEKNFLNKPTQSLVRLCEPVKNTNRNVTSDNWFSSIEAVEELSKRGLTYVGTLKKDKLIIPSEFLPNTKRTVGSSDHAFNGQNTLVSFVPKKNRAVVLISNMHHSAHINEESGKPEIIMFYNETKCGVDLMDMRCAVYSSGRRTRRWPLAVFYRLVNVCSVNTFIMYLCYKDSPVISRYDFLKRLSLELMKPHLQKRLTIQNLPRQTKEVIKMALKQEDEEVQPDGIPSDKLPKRKTCSKCPYVKERKTQYKCIKCSLPICLECSRKVCTNCAIDCV